MKAAATIILFALALGLASADGITQEYAAVRTLDMQHRCLPVWEGDTPYTYTGCAWIGRYKYAGGVYARISPSTESATVINAIREYHEKEDGVPREVRTTEFVNQAFSAAAYYHVDPGLMFGMFFKESNYGKSGIANGNKAMGNIRCNGESFRYVVNGVSKTGSCKNGFKAFPSFADSAWHMAWQLGRYIGGQVGNHGKLETIDKIVPAYAPKSDGNNEKLYACVVLREMTYYNSHRQTRCSCSESGVLSC